MSGIGSRLAAWFANEVLAKTVCVQPLQMYPLRSSSPICSLVVVLILMVS